MWISVMKLIAQRTCLELEEITTNHSNTLQRTNQERLKPILLNMFLKMLMMSLQELELHANNKELESENSLEILINWDLVISLKHNSELVWIWPRLFSQAQNLNKLPPISKLQKKADMWDGEIFAIMLMRYSQRRVLKRQLIWLLMMPELKQSMEEQIPPKPRKILQMRLFTDSSNF